MRKDYQQRVYDERSELSGKIAKLEAFTNDPAFQGVPKDERARMTMQLIIMQAYERILLQRIEAFEGP